MDGRMDARKDRWRDKRWIINGKMDGGGWKDEWEDKEINEQVGGWMGGEMDGRKEGRMDGWGTGQ